MQNTRGQYNHGQSEHLFCVYALLQNDIVDATGAKYEVSHDISFLRDKCKMIEQNRLCQSKDLFMKSMSDRWCGLNELAQNERNPWKEMYWRNEQSTMLEGLVTVNLMKAADSQLDRYT